MARRTLAIPKALMKRATVRTVALPALSTVDRRKYRNVPTVYNGVRYDSKSEAAQARHLDDLKPLGIWWVGQPKFRLGCPENVYVADFLVVDPTMGVHVEDVKGKETAKFKRDCRLWKRYGPCPLWIIRGGVVETIIDPAKEP